MTATNLTLRASLRGGRSWQTACWCAVAGTLLVAGCQRPSELGPVANVATAARIREVLASGGGGGAGPAAVATGTGWATLKGRITYDGVPPTMPAYGVSSNQAVCAPGGVAPPQEFLVVDDGSRGIANVVIFPRKASRVHESAGPSSDPIVFDQKECVFLTHVLAFSVNQPVQIKNSDPVGHNTKIAGRNSFNQTVPENQTIAYSAVKEEALPVDVRCSIHPWMLSYMFPRENAYVAVTGPDGSFEIPNLPAGEALEFQVWHENAAGSNGAVVVSTEAAKELGWSNKGRFKITLEENQPREIEIAVPASAFKGG